MYGYDADGNQVYVSYDVSYIASLFAISSPVSAFFGGYEGGGDVEFATRAIESVRRVVCHAPPVGGGGAVDMYAGVGGTIAGGAGINPRNGQISLSFDLGVGIGIGGGARVNVGRSIGIGKPGSEALPVVSAGLNANATAVFGPIGGATGSYQLLGGNKGDYSAGYTTGADVTANANISSHIQVNLPRLYDIGC